MKKPMNAIWNDELGNALGLPDAAQDGGIPSRHQVGTLRKNSSPPDR